MKYCILAAGIGSRNNSISGLHKGLLPIQNMAMISHVINKFDKEKEIIITVGHLAEQIKSYVKFIHYDKKIKFIEIDKFSGEGSGPGYSLLQCKKELQCPFVFAPIDTFVDEEIKFDVNNNWIGVVKISKQDSKKYCLVHGKKKLESIYYGEGDMAYNGIAGIFDYQDFWKELEKPNLINKEHQVTTGFEGLKDVELKYFENLHDTGTEESYKNVKKKFSKEIVFPKNDETIFIDNEKVIKYFFNKTKCGNRIKRVKYLNNFSPEIKKINSNMFGYDFIDGELLSNIDNSEVFSEFLEKFYEFSIKNVECIDVKKFRENCDQMYRVKTHERIKKFLGKDLDNIRKINGIQIEGINKILDKLDWEKICSKAIPANFHGDLQPENIIITTSNKIFLIDWRESFNDNLKTGDLYYDLSKLYHGLLINGTIAIEKKFSIKIEKNQANISHVSKNNLKEFNKKLELFCKKQKIDYEHIKLLGFLHYINIAEFYEKTEPEYSKFIFLLGKLLMTEHLEKNSD